MLRIFGIAVGSGLVFGVIFALIGLIAAPAVGLVDEFVGPLAGAFVGFLIGYPIGPIIGLFMAKRVLHYQGSVLCCALSIFVVSAVVEGMRDHANDLENELIRLNRAGAGRRRIRQMIEEYRAYAKLVDLDS